MSIESVRLHITPLTPELLKTAVGPRLLDSVSNLSFHTIQTFPENSYGYLDLPRMEGDKLKKKLNGAIVKGKKISVEEARPKKRRRTEEAEVEPVQEPPADATRTRTKKSKKEHNIIAGHEIPSDRKVKRGWTETKTSPAAKPQKVKSSSSSSKSKYTDKEELLFRTNVPDNKLDNTDFAHKKKGRTRTSKGEHTVHEFEKSTMQPSFLKQDIGLGIKGNLEYVEGQGWVDESGKTVEQENEVVAKRRNTTTPRTRSRSQPTVVEDQPLAQSTPNAEDVRAAGKDEEGQDSEVGAAEETSSSGSSPASNSSDDDSVESPESIAGESGANGQSEVHPLEALFKKPNKPTSQDVAKPSLEISTSFSFFDAEHVDDLEDEPIIPLTPFSSQEFRSRGLRSAAPTPDTAHPSRFNSYGSSELPGDEDEEETIEPRSSEPSGKKHAAEQSTRTISDFEKKFWENRAENNRAWKLRRRTVLKEKRQRENKARRPKNW